MQVDVSGHHYVRCSTQGQRPADFHASAEAVVRAARPSLERSTPISRPSAWLDGPAGGRAAPRRNRLLAALPATEQRQLLSRTERVHLPRGRALIEPGDQLGHAHFPCAGVLSILAVMEDGTPVEVSTVGNEGFVDPTALLSTDRSSYQVLCQTDVDALRMSVADLRAAFRESEPLRDLLLRYAAVVLGCTGRSLACKVVHSAEQRLARWLLMTRDRMDTDALPLTQELLAKMLGVRRATVSQAAKALHARGLIRYHRGTIVISDHQGLETVVCTDYRAFREDYDRLFGAGPPPA